MLPFLEKKNLSLLKSQLQLLLATLSEQCYSQRSQAPRSKLLYMNSALKPFLCSPVVCFHCLSLSIVNFHCSKWGPHHGIKYFQWLLWDFSRWHHNNRSALIIIKMTIIDSYLVHSCVRLGTKTWVCFSFFNLQDTYTRWELLLLLSPCWRSKLRKTDLKQFAQDFISRKW